MIEIRFHGRGGQGAVTAANLLAIAAAEDQKQSQSFPLFGVERRGAPIMAFTRISDTPIRIHQNVYTPTHVVVLDASLLTVVNVSDGLQDEGKVIVNAPSPSLCKKLEKGELCTVDASTIAKKNLGKDIVNTALLGAVAKATGIVTLDSLKKAVAQVFKGKLLEPNLKALEECYNETKIGGSQ